MGSISQYQLLLRKRTMHACARGRRAKQAILAGFSITHAAAPPSSRLRPSPATWMPAGGLLQGLGARRPTIRRGRARASKVPVNARGSSYYVWSRSHRRRERLGADVGAKARPLVANSSPSPIATARPRAPRSAQRHRCPARALAGLYQPRCSQA